MTPGGDSPCPASVLLPGKWGSLPGLCDEEIGCDVSDGPWSAPRGPVPQSSGLCLTGRKETAPPHRLTRASWYLARHPGAGSPAFPEAPGPWSTLGGHEVTWGCVPAPKMRPGPVQLGAGPGLECTSPWRCFPEAPEVGASGGVRVPRGRCGGPSSGPRVEPGWRLLPLEMESWVAPSSSAGSLMSPEGQGWGPRLPPAPLKVVHP